MKPQRDRADECSDDEWSLVQSLLLALQVQSPMSMKEKSRKKLSDIAIKTHDEVSNVSMYVDARFLLNFSNLYECASIRRGKELSLIAESLYLQSMNGFFKYFYTMHCLHTAIVCCELS